jgi:hypothetical protein
MDPISAALIAFGITVFVQILALTIAKLVNWFTSKKRISMATRDTVGVVLAQRLNSRNYATIPGVFNKSGKTQLVQAMFDTASQKIIDARAVTSGDVDDAKLTAGLRSGDGMLVFT